MKIKIMLFVTCLIILIILGITGDKCSYEEITSCYDKHNNEMIGVKCNNVIYPMWVMIPFILIFVFEIIIFIYILKNWLVN